MTVLDTGALTHNSKSWDAINWRKAWLEVKRLQMRIAQATMAGKFGKVKSLQWLLTHSYYAKALAVKRVTSNKGKRTPGVDNILWSTNKAKIKGIDCLVQHGYKSQPLRRIYIEKKSSGKYRPLSIPTMKDRAMQALYKLALSPVAETTADPNSHGFREGRRCADAIATGFNALSKPNSATWVLEADIAGCYDNISQQWLLQNIPMERRILKQWLKAGYIENNKRYPTRKGTPQGGIISPTLANMTLDGLESVVKNAVKRRNRINFVRYADDFIITGKSKQILENDIKPVVEAFLEKRGLSLSKEKTKITYIRDGFTFLGQTFKRHDGKLRISPAKAGTLELIRKVGKIIHKYVSASTIGLIKELNQVLRGWANYHRFVVSGKAFKFVDQYVYNQLMRMLKRRHDKKSTRWIAEKYWLRGKKLWRFAAESKDKKKVYELFRTKSVATHRFRKIKSNANPYLPEYIKYFVTRRNVKEATLRSMDSARKIQKELKLNPPGYSIRVALQNA
jgi:RNA-directed DNA polymerase